MSRVRMRKFYSPTGGSTSYGWYDWDEVGCPLEGDHDPNVPQHYELAVMHFLATLDPADVYAVTEVRKFDDPEYRTTTVYYLDRKGEQP